jgi:hypothetical protein
LLYYRFIVRMAPPPPTTPMTISRTAAGARPPNLEDDSYVITVYDPDFQPH